MRSAPRHLMLSRRTLECCSGHPAVGIFETRLRRSSSGSARMSRPTRYPRTVPSEIRRRIVLTETPKLSAAIASPDARWNDRRFGFGGDVVSQVLLESSGHELWDGERPFAGIALGVGVVTSVGVQLTTHMQGCAAVIVPLDVASLESQALPATQLAPGGKRQAAP